MEPSDSDPSSSVPFGSSAVSPRPCLWLLDDSRSECHTWSGWYALMQSDFIEVTFSLSPILTQSFTMQRKSSRRDRISSVGRWLCLTAFTACKSSENSDYAFKPLCP